MSEDEREARLRAKFDAARDELDLPPLHPRHVDLIESERCPRCGEPGLVLDRRGGFVTYACAACTPWLTSYRKPEEAER